jgi:hypothetical protein
LFIWSSYATEQGGKSRMKTSVLRCPPVAIVALAVIVLLALTAHSRAFAKGGGNNSGPMFTLF